MGQNKTTKKIGQEAVLKSGGKGRKEKKRKIVWQRERERRRRERERERERKKEKEREPIIKSLLTEIQVYSETKIENQKQIKQKEKKKTANVT